MIKIDIPGRNGMNIEYLVDDYNRTTSRWENGYRDGSFR